jgi:hypothetical protein
MSGGYFEHQQFSIQNLAEELAIVLEKCDIEPDKINENEDKYYYDESGSLKEYIEDIPRFKTEVEKAIYHLKMAHTMVQRIDWFLSGDDGENTFYNRLQEDLLAIEK